MDCSNEALCRKAQNGDGSARDELLSCGLSVLRIQAVKFQKKYAKFALELDDLIQAGGLGLLRAIETYDPTRGAQFLTYAGKLAENSMLDLVRSEMGQFAYQAGEHGVEIFSLDAPPPGENSDSWADLVIDPFARNPEGICLEKERIMEVRQAIANLKDREKEYVQYRFGFDEEDRERTVAECAKHFHLTRSRAGKLEQQALSDVRKNLPW